MPVLRKTFPFLSPVKQRRIERVLDKFALKWNAPLSDILPSSIRPHAGNGTSAAPLEDDPRNWGISLLLELWALAKLTPDDSQKAMQLLCQSVEDRHRLRVVNGRQPNGLSDRERWPAVLAQDVRRTIEMIEAGALEECEAAQDSEPAGARTVGPAAQDGGQSRPSTTITSATVDTTLPGAVEERHSSRAFLAVATPQPTMTGTEESAVSMPPLCRSTEDEGPPHNSSESFQSFSRSTPSSSHKPPSTEPDTDSEEQDEELLELNIEIAEQQEAYHMHAAEAALAKRKACEMKLKLRKLRRQERGVRGSV